LKLLLDEMISPRIARELRGLGFDVQAIKSDRPDLKAVADREIVRRLAAEKRAVVTNDVLDFGLIHSQMSGAGEEHFGMLFTNDATMPRNKASIPLWVKTLKAILEASPADDALRNRVRHLLPTAPAP
jgi:predicted nuclease of predicted toxin-antitoxin system